MNISLDVTNKEQALYLAYHAIRFELLNESFTQKHLTSLEQNYSALSLKQASSDYKKSKLEVYTKNQETIVKATSSNLNTTLFAHVGSTLSLATEQSLEGFTLQDSFEFPALDGRCAILGVNEASGLTQTAKTWLAEQNITIPSSLLSQTYDANKVRLFYGDDIRIALVGIKKAPSAEEGVKLTEQFGCDAQSLEQDKYRKAAQAAMSALIKDDKANTLVAFVDTMDGYDQQVAEGVVLGSYEFAYDDGIVKKQSIPKPKFHFYATKASDSFQRGLVYAKAQVMSATLAETPSNLLTPVIYAEWIKNKFESLKNPNLTVEIKDKAWAQSMGMNCFLAVAQGSDEEPRIVIIRYLNNTESKDYDLALVGKGITFDTGGVCLKPYTPTLKAMKGDMGGSAVMMASLYGLISLNMKLNVLGMVMLCENMLSGKSVKPGDTVRAMNKKSVEIDNTDAEGRLILADALCYASLSSPRVMIDCATLTGAIGIALGGAASGCFTSSLSLWKVMEQASFNVNEPLWRMPLFKEWYLGQMKSNVADLCNIGGSEGGSCTAACFLSEFVDFTKVKHWCHLDIANTMLPGYNRPAMTGRPTRCVIEFAKLLENKQI